MKKAHPDIPAIHLEFGNDIGNKVQALVNAANRSEEQEAYAAFDAATDHLSTETRHRLLSLVFPG